MPEGEEASLLLVSDILERRKYGTAYTLLVPEGGLDGRPEQVAVLQLLYEKLETVNNCAR